ncbi:hypothetical protein HDV05_003935 [Chytridiales sp. JEL 0842]|nr:hypothetical protein HDV05_003935 [Chytridiales sp. JEL 0842]
MGSSLEGGAERDREERGGSGRPLLPPPPSTGPGGIPPRTGGDGVGGVPPVPVGPPPRSGSGMLMGRVRVVEYSRLPETLQYAWNEKEEKELERLTAERRRIALEDDKNLTEMRKLKFDSAMADWEVSKWEHQLELINKQLEEHDAELLMLQQASMMASNSSSGSVGSTAVSFEDTSALGASGSG